MVPWFFALDHHNYARWASVHIRDLENLPPDVFDEFQRGRWVVSKTGRRFSAMPIDQAHEQNNAKIEGLGGAVGLTEQPSAFQKWMLAGPEQVRLMDEFEGTQRISLQEMPHHEESVRATKGFPKRRACTAKLAKQYG